MYNTEQVRKTPRLRKAHGNGALEWKDSRNGFVGSRPFCLGKLAGFVAVCIIYSTQFSQRLQLYWGIRSTQVHLEAIPVAKLVQYSNKF